MIIYDYINYFYDYKNKPNIFQTMTNKVYKKCFR